MQPTDTNEIAAEKSKRELVDEIHRRGISPAKCRTLRGRTPSNLRRLIRRAEARRVLAEARKAQGA